MGVTSREGSGTSLRAYPSQEHHPRCFAPARSGQSAAPARLSSQRNTAVSGRGAQRSLVRRFQGRVQTQQRALLHYCYPLTVTDQASRFALRCEALESTREDTAIVSRKTGYKIFAGYKDHGVEASRPSRSQRLGRPRWRHGPALVGSILQRAKVTLRNIRRTRSVYQRVYRPVH
jgi:hypothetical protein